MKAEYKRSMYVIILNRSLLGVRGREVNWPFDHLSLLGASINQSTYLAAKLKLVA